MIPSLVLLGPRPAAIARPPSATPPDAAQSKAGPSAAAGAPTTASKDEWVNSSDESGDSDDEPHRKTSFERVYPTHAALRLLDWGLLPTDALALLREFGALYAYQAGDTLSQMVADSYCGRSVEARLQRSGRFYEIKALGALRALVFLSNPDARAALRPMLPEDLATRLENDAVPLGERVALAEAVLLLLLEGSGGRRLKKRAMDEWDVPGDRALAESAATNMRATRFDDDGATWDAQWLLEFVKSGLQAAFQNPQMTTMLPAGTVLYHGSGIVDDNGRKFDRNQDRRAGRKLTEFARSFEEEVRYLTLQPVSTTTSVTTGYNFYKSSGYGSLFCFELKNPVPAIVYSTLDRNKSLWDGKPEEYEVLLPPGLKYELLKSEECKTRPSVGATVYRVLVSKPPPELSAAGKDEFAG